MLTLVPGAFPDPLRPARSPCKSMSPHIQTLGWTALLGAACVVADCFRKRASCAERPLVNIHFAIGAAMYAVSAAGWVYLLRDTKLATIGAIYSMTVIVMLNAVGVVWCGEPMSGPEMVGVCLAIAATFLLAGRS